MNPKTRESNFELLRILCMLIIILSHFNVHGGFDTNLIVSPLNKYFIQSNCLGKIGVDCFILISGYFLVNSSFRLKRLIQLELQTLTYSIGIGLCTFLLLPDIFGNASFLSVFFPTLTGTYWFMSTYLLLYILAPFMNFFLKRAEQKMIEMCLLVLISVYILIPTLTTYTIGGSSSISTYITLYMIGGYIRLYPTRLKLFSMRLPNLLLAIGSYLFIVGSVIFFNYVPVRSYAYFTNDNSVSAVLMALGLFLYCKNMPTFHSSFVNAVSASTLAVYLIHDNPFMREILWKKMLHNAAYANSPWLIVYALACVCGVFIICILIDKVRGWVVEKPVMKIVDWSDKFFHKM